MQECITLKDQHTSITSLHDFLYRRTENRISQNTRSQEQRKKKWRRKYTTNWKRTGIRNKIQTSR